jgi:ATP-binding cassette subfamily F protein uup
VTILSAKELRRTYGIREVLRGASLSIDERERVGLVGRNGSGKSTLAKILAGAEQPDSGEVVRRSELRVAYLPQEPEFPPGLRAVDAVLAGLERCCASKSWSRPRSSDSAVGIFATKRSRCWPSSGSPIRSRRSTA